MLWAAATQPEKSVEKNAGKKSFANCYLTDEQVLPTKRIFSPYAPVTITRPIMRQTWQDLTFLHWRYDPEVIRRALPPQLTLDSFDGSAWVGLAPFVLAGVRPFGLPPMPWISRFPETNVRTYVLGPDGQPGVWFFTLEADRLLAVLAARACYKLPYRWAAMSVQASGQTVEYRSRRNRLFGQGATDLALEVGATLQTQDFDNFLTARFRLYAVHRSRVAFAEIDHDPWPLQRGKVVRLDEDLIVNSGVPAPVGEPVVHFSRALQVRVAPLRWL
jgi:uncharacterized protein YqjF (DUF2071 family)